MDAFNKLEQSQIKEKLINCVFGYSEIWDKRLLEHRNREIITDRWNRVASEMGLDGKCIFRQIHIQ